MSTTPADPSEERNKRQKLTRNTSIADLVSADETLGPLFASHSSLFQEQPPEFFDKKYKLGMMIGEGATGKVFLGKCRETLMDVAVKIIHEKVFIKNSEIIREILILRRLSHPNIIKLIDVVVTNDKLYIIMELARGPELFDLIVEKKNYGEQDAAKVIRQICSALHYLHSNNVSHRDLKPENILYFSDSENAPIKLVDFGLSTTSEELKSNMTGTLGYKAPELFLAAKRATEGVTEGVTKDDGVTKGVTIGSPGIEKGVKEGVTEILNVPGAPCDMWAVGIISYILLCGFPPFFSEAHFDSCDFRMNAPFWVFFNEETPLLIEQIMEKNISFPPQFWESVSDSAKDFVSRLLEKDPDKRLTAKKALLHPFLSPLFPSPSTTPLPKATETLSFFVKKKQKFSKKFKMILEDSPSSGSFSHSPFLPPSPSPLSSPSPSLATSYPSSSPFSSSLPSLSTSPSVPPLIFPPTVPSLSISSSVPSPSIPPSPSFTHLSLPVSSSNPSPSRSPPLTSSPSCSPMVKSPRNVKGRRMSLVVGRVPAGNEYLISPRIHRSLISLDRTMSKDNLKEKLINRPGRNEERVKKILEGGGEEKEKRETKRVVRVLQWENEEEVLIE